MTLSWTSLFLMTRKDSTQLKRRSTLALPASGTVVHCARVCAACARCPTTPPPPIQTQLPPRVFVGALRHPAWQDGCDEAGPPTPSGKSKRSSGAVGGQHSDAHLDSVSVPVAPVSMSPVIHGWGPGSILRRIRRTLKLEAFSLEYQALRRQLRKLLSDAATLEAPCLSATSMLMRVLAMRVVSVGSPGAERTGRRLLGQYLNGKADATKEHVNEKVGGGAAAMRALAQTRECLSLWPFVHVFAFPLHLGLSESGGNVRCRPLAHVKC